MASWWDYGYQTTAMANRTVIVDNNTWNNTHIATVRRREAEGCRGAGGGPGAGSAASSGTGGWACIRQARLPPSCSGVPRPLRPLANPPTPLGAHPPRSPAQVGRAMASPERKAWQIFRSLDVEYVFVVFGGYIGCAAGAWAGGGSGGLGGGAAGVARQGCKACLLLLLCCPHARRSARSAAHLA